LDEWQRQGRLVPFCPETAGGLPVPREAAEICDGNADGVLDGHARVLTAGGVDVTAAFLHGAEEALGLCLREGIGVAVLKEGSPSCAVREVGDGTFTGHRLPGRGVTARHLERHGIRICNEYMLEAVAATYERDGD
jgi:Uncharacterized conserved protein